VNLASTTLDLMMPRESASEIHALRMKFLPSLESARNVVFTQDQMTMVLFALPMDASKTKFF
jgi:hypothetical protein